MDDRKDALRVFGAAPPGVVRHPRAAAYAVVLDAAGRVAVIRGASGVFLPGGGSLAGETPEATVIREVREEVGYVARLLGRIGDAVQLFYAGDDDRWYEMTASFFRTELLGPPVSPRESELMWLHPVADRDLFFHECHAWAAGTR